MSVEEKGNLKVSYETASLSLKKFCVTSRMLKNWTGP